MYEKLDSALATFGSACETCDSIICSCCEDNDEENLFELRCTFPSSFKTPSVLYTDTIYDKVSDGFIVICALFALSFNRVIDFVLEGFKKAYRSGRI